MTRMQKYMQLVKYAELCWASYSEGLREGMFGIDSKGRVEGLSVEELKKLPTYHQALTESQFLIFEKYNVNFSNSQANHFITRFEVSTFSQDNDTGFSATLFEDTQKDKFVVGFRGTECRF